MKNMIKYNAPKSQFIKQFGEVYHPEHGTYFYIPVYFKQTDSEDAYEELSFTELPKPIREMILEGQYSSDQMGDMLTKVSKIKSLLEEKREVIYKNGFHDGFGTGTISPNLSKEGFEMSIETEYKNYLKKKLWKHTK